MLVPEPLLAIADGDPPLASAQESAVLLPLRRLSEPQWTICLNNRPEPFFRVAGSTHIMENDSIKPPTRALS